MPEVYLYDLSLWKAMDATRFFRGVRHGTFRRTRFRNPLNFTWISDFRLDFWISKWISGFHVDFRISKWISTFWILFEELLFVGQLENTETRERKRERY